MRRRPSGLRVPPVTRPSTTGATERASRTITNAIPPSTRIPATSAVIIVVLVFELDSWVLAAVVLVATFGVLVTCGVTLGTCVESFAPAEGCFAAWVATLPTPLAGFAACVEDCAAPPNRFPASLAPAGAAGNRTSRDSASAAYAHAAGRSLIGRDALIGMDGRIELIPQRRA